MPSKNPPPIISPYLKEVAADLRPEVFATPRKYLRAGLRAQVYARTGMICARIKCNELACQIDHVIPLWMGGADDISNMEGLCETHHKTKTRIDASARAKVKRLLAKRFPDQVKADPAPEPKTAKRRYRKRKLKSRGFAKGLRRKVNGDVEPRA
jgi:5-methylcytosine-specific restriction endonuclease McrA